MLHLMRLPRRPVFQHGIEDDQQFPHARGQRQLLRLPGLTQALIEEPPAQIL